MHYRFIPKNLNLGLTCIWRDVLKVPPKCRTRISKNVILANCTRCKFIHSLASSKRGENMALIGLGLHSCQAGMGIRWWWLWTSGGEQVVRCARGHYAMWCCAMLVIDLLCFDHHVFGGRPIYVTTSTCRQSYTFIKIKLECNKLFIIRLNSNSRVSNNRTYHF